MINIERGNKVIIRRLTLEDIEAQKETLIRFIFESTRNSAYTNSFLMRDAEEKCRELCDYVKNGRAVVYGALFDIEGDKHYKYESLVGFVWAYEYPFRDDKRRLYVSILHVDSSFRECGIGADLLSAVEVEAKNGGYSAIFLHVEGHNEGAIRFYHREKFEIERIQMVHLFKD